MYIRYSYAQICNVVTAIVFSNVVFHFRMANVFVNTEHAWHVYISMRMRILFMSTLFTNISFRQTIQIHRHWCWCWFQWFEATQMHDYVYKIKHKLLWPYIQKPQCHIYSDTRCVLLYFVFHTNSVIWFHWMFDFGVWYRVRYQVRLNAIVTHVHFTRLHFFFHWHFNASDQPFISYAWSSFDSIYIFVNQFCTEHSLRVTTFQWENIYSHEPDRPNV